MLESLFLIKLQAFRPATLLKKTPTQVLSCEYWEIFKNSFFHRTSANGCFCASEVEPFAEIVNNWQLKAVNYFRKKFHLRYPTRFWIRLCICLLNSCQILLWSGRRAKSVKTVFKWLELISSNHNSFRIIEKLFE